MIRSVLLSILLATVLAGQSSVFTTNPAGQSGRPRTLKEFLQRTADPDPLFLLEDGSPGADAFLDLAKEDPLLEWGLTPRRFGPEDPLQKELREREGWPKGPRWALLDGRGRVRAIGTLPTTARELGERLREGGYRPRYELLQEFLRRQPDRGDAWADLLLAQRSRAFRLLRPLRKPASAGASLTNPLPGAPELVHPLSEAEDERLFAPVAAALHGLLEVEGWGESLSSWMFFPDNPELHSPRLRDEARIQLPKVEAFLRGRPSHVYGWMLWAFLFPLTDRDPPTFLQDLVAVPGTRSEIPPAVALPELMRQFRRLERWSSVKAIATPR